MKFILIAAFFCKVLSQPDPNDPNFVFPGIRATSLGKGRIVSILDTRSPGENVSNVGEARKECKKKYNSILATPFSLFSAKQLVRAYRRIDQGRH